MDMPRKICIAIVAIALFLAVAAPSNTLIAQTPEVHAAAHILVELESGRVLSDYKAHERMFPAATTMILTAILAYEYIGMDEILIAGNEVLQLPQGSARNHHEVDEAILGINLLRGMLIGRGNDTANIAVMEVARRHTGNENISFANAQVTFANLMTERAAELGAIDSRFINPHGYHHDSHFSTAYDMAQIARHALSIPTLAEIMRQTSFSGSMSGGGDAPASVSRTWHSQNELLLEGGEHHYPYAIGMRTGMTNQAGYSLVAAAVRNVGGDDITLVSVTFNSPIINEEPTRWQDNINLFEYGFENYAHRVFHEGNVTLGGLPIYDPRMDDEGYLEFYSADRGVLFLSQTELNRIQSEIVFDSDIAEYSEEYGQMFIAPIFEGDIVGSVSYHLDGEIIFSANLYAARYVPIRTTASDIDFRMERINEIFFSASAIPYWIAAVAVLILIVVLIVIARRSIKRKKNNYKYKWKY
ncbi:MAG: hypothetical protein FWE34_03475 [Defluviitaleaceae bacterium]|nr:hypothetical protein [Defluviitaleaceae bacterium]